MTTLKEVSDLAKALTEQQGELAKLEEQITAKKASIKRLEEELIPEALQSVGLTEIKLESGETISYTRQYFASISEENADKAFKWLKDNKYGSLIKTQITMKFGQGLEEQVDLKVAEDFLKGNEIEFDEKKSVHPQTLKAFVKGRMEEEADVSKEIPPEKKLPREIFGVYMPLKTVVTAPKQTK